MKHKVGIIGLGVGESHIKGYQTHPDCEVVRLCDLSEKKRSIATKKYPDMKITGVDHDILRDPEINIVSIASYDDHHYNQIITSLNNKKHVFVEKPLCLYREEAVHIKSLLREKKQLKLTSNLILRKCPRFQALKKMIDSGEFKKLYFIEGDYNYGKLTKITDGWRGSLDFYSIIYGGGIHMVDLILWLTGEKVVEVAAYGTNISTRGSRFRYNDMIACILKFESGMVGKISVNFGCVMPHFHGLSIYGTGATFMNGMEYGMFFESRDPRNPAKKIFDEYPGVHKGDLVHGFVDSIVNNTQDEISQDDIFDAMSVCFAIEKAVSEGKTVKVEYI